MGGAFEGAIRVTHRDKVDRVGLWQAGDYSRFAALCCDYWMDDGELQRNPVYRWFQTHVPRALALSDGEPPELPYKRMLIVAEHIIMATQPDTRRSDEAARAREWHKKAQTQIRQLQKILGARPYLLLPRLNKALANALPLLDSRSTKASQPWIERLARALYDQTGAADAQLLLEVASALELDLHERTAQRYVKEAREADR